MIVQLSLDSSKFTKGQKDSVASLKKLEDQSNKTSKELESHAKKSAEGFNHLKGELLAIGALLAGAFGLKDFISGTIQQTAALGRMSTNLDMSKVRLAEWQQAVVMAGGTSEEATAQLKSHAAALAEFGRTGKTEGTILGETQKFSGYYGKKPFIPQNVHGAEDLLAQQADIIRAIAEKDNNASALQAAGKMGIGSEDFFNILKNGSEALKNNLDSFKDVAESQAKLADSSEELRKEFITVENEFTKMANEVMPSVNKGLKEFGDYLISPEFKESLAFLGKEITWVGKMFEWIGKAIGNTFGWLDVHAPKESLPVTKIEGKPIVNKDAQKTQDDFVRSASNLINKNSQPSKVDGSPIVNQDRASIVGKLVAMGWSPAQAAGMAGSLQQESHNFNPADENPDSHMYGIAQWDTNRRKKFQEIMGKSIYGSSVDDQLKFMNWELNHSHKLAGDKIRAAKTPAEAAQAHSDYYEVASKTGKWAANDSKRIANANNILAAYQSSNAASVSSVPLAFRNGGSQVTSNGGTTTVSTNINTINVNTQATDASGISNDIGAAIKRNMQFGANNLNTGLS